MCAKSSIRTIRRCPTSTMLFHPEFTAPTPTGAIRPDTRPGPDTDARHQHNPPRRAPAMGSAGYAPKYEAMPYLQHASRRRTTSTPHGRVRQPDCSMEARIRRKPALLHQLPAQPHVLALPCGTAGRQNDIQGNGEPNWATGYRAFRPSTTHRLGDQSKLPETSSASDSKGHNVFYISCPSCWPPRVCSIRPYTTTAPTPGG